MAQQKQTPRNADAPVQDSLGGMAKRLLSAQHLAALWQRGAKTWKEDGTEQLWRDVTFRVALAMHHDRWQHRADLPTRRQLKHQRQNPLAEAPKVSIIVPLYNTPARYLDDLLASVKKQTYPNWQLCLADASDAAHADVAHTCRAAAQKDARIVYQKLAENKGIAANTNEGFAMADGAWLALLDHDDELYPNALYEMLALAQKTGAEMAYSDEIVLSDDKKELRGYHFKPGFAPDFLNGCNYITHLCLFTRALFLRAGGRENPEFDGSQDYDLILRLTENLSTPDKIVHLPKVLYTWRAGKNSTAENLVEAKPYAVEAGRRAIAAHLARIGRKATVESIPEAPGAYHVRYALTGSPKISVLIPNRDHADDLDRCLASLYAHAGYENFEVIVAENNSTMEVTEAYYRALPKKYPNSRVVRWEGAFNFSAINNFARRAAAGEYLLLLNNDIEILSDGFLAEMLSYAQRPDVGAVGAKLYYPDDTIQHGGVILGINGSAGHSHKSHPRKAVGDLFRLITAQDYLAVTGACLMVKASLYDACGGLDEGDFAVAYNDIDLCLKLHEQGYLNVYTPLAEAYHYESKSRGLDEGNTASAANQARYAREKAAFQARWGKYLPEGADPYYNIHFNNQFENFGLK
ncbi:MAG: glycosyltransferase family 2 protein [Faecalibacterium sp.]|jgi:GT2 family glycosyltransferase|nr:glycosyltransferase family 2 protein [Faecalibacterium sp.]